VIWIWIWKKKKLETRISKTMQTYSSLMDSILHTEATSQGLEAGTSWN
jgi:hypothetical protein